MREIPVGSVVVPVRNGRDVLSHQLNALAAQTLIDQLEIVVVDDASDDGTAEVAERWRAQHPHLHVQFLRRSRRGGPNASRNAGIRAAKAKLIFLCDGDDVVAPDWAERLLHAYSRHAHGNLLVTGRLVRLDLNNQLTNVTIFELLQYEGFDHILGGNAAFSRQLAIDVNGFDEQIVAGGTEVDFSLRTIAHGAEVVYVPEAVVGYRIPTTFVPAFRRYFKSCRGHEYLRYQTYQHRSGPPPLRSYVYPWKRLARELARALAGHSSPDKLAQAASQALGTSWWGLVFRVRLPPKRLAKDLGN